jgi:MoaA/NifB/PqqE/SkfB family radical SAM enzyme
MKITVEVSNQERKSVRELIKRVDAAMNYDSKGFKRVFPGKKTRVYSVRVSPFCRKIIISIKEEFLAEVIDLVGDSAIAWVSVYKLLEALNKKSSELEDKWFPERKELALQRDYDRRASERLMEERITRKVMERINNQNQQ